MKTIDFAERAVNEIIADMKANPDHLHDAWDLCKGWQRNIKLTWRNIIQIAISDCIIERDSKGLE